MNTEFVNPFINSMLSVMGMMAQVDMIPGDIQEKSNALALGDVSGIIDMSCDKSQGSMAISFDTALALAVMNNMLGDAPEGITDEVSDLVGELTNMVNGGAKQELEELGFDFGMATPAIYVGDEHELNHAVEAKTYLISFGSEEGNAYIEICFNNLN